MAKKIAATANPNGQPEAPMKDGVKFKKAKIKNELFLYAEWTEELPGHSKNDLKNDCTVPVHDDLKAAFQNLHRHLAYICNVRDVPPKKQLYKVDHEEFSVTGFSIGGNDDSTGVTITGTMEGIYGTVNLPAPL